jgi:MoxR-like ATPase
MMKVDVDYADKNIEKEIYKKLNTDFYDVKIEKVLSKENIFEIWNVLKQIYISDNIYDYVSKIIDATRSPENY